MKWWGVPVFVFLGLLGLPASAAKPPSPPGLHDCVEGPQQPICLLRIAGERDLGLSLFEDRDLATLPDLIAQTGYTLAAAQERESVQIGPLENPFSDYGWARRGAFEAWRLDREGRSPDEALAILRATSNAEETMTPGKPPSTTRLLGYARLLQPAPAATRPSAALMAAALADWEKTLTGLDDLGYQETGPVALVRAYRRAGDTAGSARALKLVGRLPLDEQIIALTELGLLEEAFALSETASAHDVLDPRRMRGVLDAKFILNTEILEARIVLAEAAAKAGRTDIARKAADLVLAELEPAGFMFEPMEHFPAIAALASPDALAARLEAMEVELNRPQVGDQRDEIVAATLLPNIATGWRVLGRKDRIDPLIARWLPIAAKEAKDARPEDSPGGYLDTPIAYAVAEILQSEGRAAEAIALLPPDLAARENFVADIREGGGVRDLKHYLALQRDDDLRNMLIRDGVLAAMESRDLGTALTILRQTGRSRGSAYSVLSMADERLAAGDMAGAQALLNLAVEEARKALDDAKVSDSLSPHLVRLAKMQLRADGRLPPLAIPSKR